MIVRAIEGEFRRYRSLAERAMSQVEEPSLHRCPLAEGNSIAILAQHLGGNLASRFADLLHQDGEASSRHREREFDDLRLSRPDLLELWARGWDRLEANLAKLSDADLHRTVTIRRVPLTVAEALARSLAHTAYHVGQIVLLARVAQGSNWQSLSIPRGASTAYAQNPDKEKPPAR